MKHERPKTEGFIFLYTLWILGLSRHEYPKCDNYPVKEGEVLLVLVYVGAQSLKSTIHQQNAISVYISCHIWERNLA